MFNVSEYRALMRTFQTFGLKQSQTDCSIFYRDFNGVVVAQIVGEKDQEYILDLRLWVDVYQNKLKVTYMKYVAVESGKLTTIKCETSCDFSVSEFIKTYSRIVDEIFDSSVYEFCSPINFEFEYKNKTPGEIVMKELKN